MKIKIFLILLLLPNLALATEHEHGADHEQVFHAFTLETDVGEGRDGANHSWDLDGWIGGDDNKLFIRSEGKMMPNGNRESNVEALYSRNISDFWDGQIGIRHDFKKIATNYLQIGFEGLAPYSSETKAHAFLSEHGDLSFKLRQEIEILITQKLITQPYCEIEVFASDVPKQGDKSGISNLEIGALTSYDITRKFAPYFALRYQTKTFSTRNLAIKNNEATDDFIASIGLRLKF